MPADFARSGVSLSAGAALGLLGTAQEGAMGALLIDVREAARATQAGHVPGAVRMPLSALSLDLAELPALTRFVVLDEDTDRAELAARFLRFRGLDESFYVEGGISAWRAAGGAWTPGPPPQ